MAKCFSFTSSRDTCYKYSFENAGLKSTTKDLGEGTTMHCWAPRKHKQNKPNLVLLHGLGANAMWQWDYFISPLIPKFNVYVPDLVFFGESYTTRSDRTESFQAQCVMKMMEDLGVKKMSVCGVSYGGFVAYSMAAQFPDAIEKLVLVCSGVCLEAKDMDEGMFKVKSVDDAASILLPQTPQKLKELMKLSFYKPQTRIPNCFLSDFIQLGAGTSLPGLVAAKVGADVTLTDDSKRVEVLENIRSVCDLNKLSCKVKGLTWGIWDAQILELHPQILLGADVLYDTSAFDDLFSTVAFLLQNTPGSVFITSYHNRSGHHLIEFLMVKWGLKCIKLLDAFSFMPSDKASGLSGNIQLAEIVYVSQQVTSCSKDG